MFLLLTAGGNTTGAAVQISAELPSHLAFWLLLPPNRVFKCVDFYKSLHVFNAFVFLCELYFVQLPLFPLGQCQIRALHHQFLEHLFHRQPAHGVERSVSYTLPFPP